MAQINIKKLNIALRGIEPEIARQAVAQLPAAIQREAAIAQPSRSARSQAPEQARVQARADVGESIAYTQTRDSRALAVALARNIVAQAHAATDHDHGESS